MDIGYTNISLCKSYSHWAHQTLTNEKETVKSVIVLQKEKKIGRERLESLKQFVKGVKRNGLCWFHFVYWTKGKNPPKKK